MAKLTKKNVVYCVLFPLTVMLLCAFSFSLGFQKGKTSYLVEEVMEDQPEMQVVSSAQELTFFDELSKSPPVVVVPKKKRVIVKKKVEAISPKQLIKKDKTLVVKREEKNENELVIQVSAFKDITKAEEFMDRLRNEGYRAFVISDELNRSWHRVFVGPYQKRSRVDSTLASLDLKGFGKGFVIEQKN